MWEKVHPLMLLLAIDHRISFMISQSGVNVMLVGICSLVDQVIGGASLVSCGEMSCHMDQSCGVALSHDLSCLSFSVSGCAVNVVTRHFPFPVWVLIAVN